MKVVGIVGPAGSGKDTAARVLLRLNRAFTRRALADCLKEDVSKLFGIELGRLYSDKRQHDDPIITRRIPQIWGTEHGRCIDPDYWFLRWSHHMLIEHLKQPIGGVVIPDIRFPNEARIVHGVFGGHLLFITRRRQFDAVTYDHASESHYQAMRARYRGEPRVAFICNESTQAIFKACCEGIFADEWGLVNSHGEGDANANTNNIA